MSPKTSRINGDLLLQKVAALFEDLESYQRARVLKTARKLDIRITSEDIFQPQNHPSLINSGPYNFEDGQLAGIVSARVAVIAELKKIFDQGDGEGSE